MLILENTSFKDNIGYHKGNDVLNVDQGIVILNNRMISGSEGNITYVKSISTAVSSIIGGLAVIFTFGAAFAVTVLTGGLAGLAVGAGVAVGGGVIFGGIAAKIITSNQYNLQFNRITTTLAVIGTCVIVGLIAAGAAYLSHGKSVDVGSKNEQKAENKELSGSNNNIEQQTEVNNKLSGSNNNIEQQAERYEEIPNINKGQLKDVEYRDHSFKIEERFRPLEDDVRNNLLDTVDNKLNGVGKTIGHVKQMLVLSGGSDYCYTALLDDGTLFRGFISV